MKHPSSIATGIVLTSACLLYASVKTDFDHKADFSRFHTYSWIGVKAGNSLWQGRITQAVDAALGAKGWNKVESGGDASVSAVGRTREQDSLQTFYDGFPGWGWRARWWGMGGGMATTEVVQERIGTLTVDVFDGSSKELIFRGQATDTLSRNPEKNDKKLEHAVDDMFKRFPPQNGER
jgi:hypothetical protein